MARNNNQKKPKIKTVRIYVMGREYRVPEGLTIMKAMEYAGYRFLRGAGCRAGFCGACGTVYRMKDDYRLYFNLACQTAVEDGMYLTQLPFTPANKAIYHIRSIKLDGNPILKFYPEVARCVSCNTCTKACPQELEVMDYIQAALKNDLEKAASLSFDCLQCGLCTIRCPAEIAQYHVGQLARRLYSRMVKTSGQLDKRIREINKGKYDDEFEEVMDADMAEIKQRYADRELETGK